MGRKVKILTDSKWFVSHWIDKYITVVQEGRERH
jgi:hypothetical protein